MMFDILFHKEAHEHKRTEGIRNIERRKHKMKTHWKKLTNPDYLGSYALEDGKDMIVTIKEVKQELITGQKGTKEECVVA